MITVRLHSATAHITVENSNQWSTVSATAKPAHRRNCTDLLSVITATCVTRVTQRRFFLCHAHQIPVEPVLFYGTLRHYS